MVRDLNALFQEIDRAPSVPALWAMMVRHFQSLGFGAIGYVLFDRGRLGQSVAIFQSGFPQEVVNTFAKLGYGNDAPALRVAMTTGRSNRANAIAETSQLSNRELAHREAIIAAGLSDALILPLYGPLGRDAMGVLAEPAKKDGFSEQIWPQLHIAAQAAHLRAFTLRPNSAEQMTGLSVRELEILRRVAQGKSNAEICEDFELSLGTVDTYLRRIFEKLDVTDRTSAAVKGVSLGLVRA